MRSHSVLWFRSGRDHLVVAMLAAGAVGAQVLDEANAGVQFNFTPPGARSLAMGGAFLGLADDATAAYTNPAGLTTLRNPEVGLEVRYTTFTHVFTDSGHDERPGHRARRRHRRRAGLRRGRRQRSSASRSCPTSTPATAGPWPPTATRSWTSRPPSRRRARTSATSTPGPWGGCSRSSPPSTSTSPTTASRSPSTSPDRVLGRLRRVVTTTSRSTRSTNRYYFDHRHLRSARPYDSDNLFCSQVQSGSDNDLAFNLGLLWRASDKFWMGAVYRDGPSFIFGYSGCAARRTPPTARRLRRHRHLRSRGTFHLPTVYGLGARLQAERRPDRDPRLDRVEYSALTEDFTGIPGLAGRSTTSPSTTATSSTSASST